MNNNSLPKLILAPMAGWTDLPFRLICRELGADVVYSEMISATGIFYNPEKSLTLAQTCLFEQPMVLQLFGNNSKHFAHATKIISHLPSPSDKESYGLYRPSGIDINFGCPAPKVFKQESGCHLMKFPEIAQEIIRAVTENTQLPASIKIRAGIDDMDALTFLEKVAHLPWQTVIVHGRTYQEGFSGKPNFEIIRKIKKLYPNKTVIANGGIYTPEDAKEMLEETLADGIAIGRGSWGNPWLFQQIKDYLSTGSYSNPSLEEIKSIVIKHAELVESTGTFNGLIEFRKHLLSYFKGFPNARETRGKLATVMTMKEVKEVVESL